MTWIAVGVLLALAVMGAILGNGSERHGASQSSPTPAGFSAWDGSNTSVVKELKRQLNDPSSFEHVSTRFSVTPERTIVLMEYRAKNGFGAVVLESCKAICDKQGNFVSWTY